MYSSINHDNAVTREKKERRGWLWECNKRYKVGREKVNSIVMVWGKKTTSLGNSVCIHWQEISIHAV